MTNERKDNGTDPKVSGAYRELAHERTPDRLNREVLRMAAREGKTRYSIMRAWVRPAAWAATIGLSLTLVLQLSNTPQSTPEAIPAAPPAQSDSFGVQDQEEWQDSLTKRSRTQLQQGRPAEKASAPSNAPTALADLADNSAVPELDSQATTPVAQAQDTTGLAEAVARSRAAPQAEAAAEFEALAERSAARTALAEPPADGMASDVEQKSHATANFAASTASIRSYADSLCSEDARETAATWFECIKENEHTAPRDVVDKEYEAFREQFPDFEELETGK